MKTQHLVSRWLRRFFPEKTLGQRGEAAAARYLRRRGYKMLARGDRFGPGELDLVVLDRDTIVFVEVKTRESHEAGHPSEAVDQVKQRRLTQVGRDLSEALRAVGASRPIRRDCRHLARRPAVAHDRAHQERLRGGGQVGVLFVIAGVRQCINSIHWLQNQPAGQSNAAAFTLL